MMKMLFPTKAEAKTYAANLSYWGTIAKPVCCCGVNGVMDNWGLYCGNRKWLCADERIREIE